MLLFIFLLDHYFLEPVLHPIVQQQTIKRLELSQREKGGEWKQGPFNGRNNHTSSVLHILCVVIVDDVQISCEA